MADFRESIELRLPSRLGYEKLAMSAAALIAEGMGFSADKVEDLKTAVSEACLNAIEHGNDLQQDKKVTVLFSVSFSSLAVDVLDEGEGAVCRISEKSGLEDKISGAASPRGLGLFLIGRLMDKAEFVPREGGTQLRMVIYLQRRGQP